MTKREHADAAERLARASRGYVSAAKRGDDKRAREYLRAVLVAAGDALVDEQQLPESAKSVS